MRTPLIAGNWKMNTTLPQAVDLVKGMRDKLAALRGVEVVLCPPFISLAAVRELLQGTNIGLGAQNMYFEEKGAYTGEVSPPMLAGLCQFVILGHSERRAYFGETDQGVNRKLKAALKADLKPILCVGERLADRESGKTEEIIVGQVRGALEGLSPPAHRLVVAYEPVWAIGTGRAATGEQANETIGLIRRTLASLYGHPSAAAVRIQYGGSANAANIAQFLSQPEVDGALVGGASLQAEEFVSMVEQAARLKGSP
ncbi:MAG: triose-phosphate isomerase [Chloroflexota bacterium]|nr:triose-phosphate isomerase [Chloroflexota bacterium]